VSIIEFSKESIANITRKQRGCQGYI